MLGCSQQLFRTLAPETPKLIHWPLAPISRSSKYRVHDSVGHVQRRPHLLLLATGNFQISDPCILLFLVTSSELSPILGQNPWYGYTLPFPQYLPLHTDLPELAQIHRSRVCTLLEHGPRLPEPPPPPLRMLGGIPMTLRDPV